MRMSVVKATTVGCLFIEAGKPLKCESRRFDCAGQLLVAWLHRAVLVFVFVVDVC